MKIERLKTLRDFLANIPQEIIEKEKFNLGSWMSTSLNREGEGPAFSVIKRFKSLKEDEKIVVEPNYCQTTGCAMGWATTIPEFKKEGLVLTTNIGNKETGYDGGVVSYRKNGHWHYQFDACEMFFKIEYGTARKLFSPDYYKFGERTHPEFVVERLDYLLEHGEEKFDQKYKYPAR